MSEPKVEKPATPASVAELDAAEDAELEELTRKLTDPDYVAPKSDDGSKKPEDTGASDAKKAGQEGSDSQKAPEQKKDPKASDKKDQSAAESTDQKGKKDKEEEDLEDKPEDSEFTKAQKAKKREAATWKKVNAQKDANETRAKELEAREKAIARERELLNRMEKSDTGKKTRYSAEQYEAAAKQLREEGDEESAKIAETKAKEIREAGGEEEAVRKREAAEQKKAATATHVKSWNDNFDQLCQKYRDLENDESPLHKETLAIIERAPVLRGMKGGVGIQHAVQIALWKIGHDSAADWKTKFEAEKKRADEAEALTNVPRTPGSSRRSTAPAKKPALQMTEAEEDAQLEKWAQEVDANR